MAKRKRIRKRKEIKVTTSKEPICRSTTGPFRQNCTIQTGVYLDVEYLCRNMSISIGRKLYPCDAVLTEEAMKEILALIRKRMTEFMTEDLADDLEFWEECAALLKKGPQVNKCRSKDNA